METELNEYVHRCDESIKRNISIKRFGNEWFIIQISPEGWNKKIDSVTACPYCNKKLGCLEDDKK